MEPLLEMVSGQVHWVAKSLESAVYTIDVGMRSLPQSELHYDVAPFSSHREHLGQARPTPDKACQPVT